MRRGRDAQALGAFAGAEADAAGNLEHHLEAADIGRGLLLGRLLERGSIALARRQSGTAAALACAAHSRGPLTDATGRGSCGYCTISEFRSGALPPRAVRTVETRERDIRPVLAGVLRDLGAAHQFERGLAVFRAGVEAGVVERRPARVAHRIGHPQRRLGRGGRREFDPDFQLARRLLRPVLFEPRDFAVEFALLALGVADRGVGAGDFLADRGKGRAPFGDRPRLALVADSGRRRLRKSLGEFAPRGGRIDRALQVGALVLQRLDALVEFGQIDRRRRARRFGVDRADGELGARLALDPQRGRIERQRKILEHGRIVAGGKIERDDARDAGAVGIDGDGIDRRTGVDIGRPRRACGQRREHDEARRQKTVRNQSHGFPPEPFAGRRRAKTPITPGHETQRGRNRFDRDSMWLRRGRTAAKDRQSSRRESGRPLRTPAPWPASPAAAPAPWRARQRAPGRRSRPARWRRRPA